MPEPNVPTVPAAPAACKMTPTPGDPQCSFRTTPGPVTLEVKDVLGSVMFLKAEYDGKPILPTPAKTITVPVVAGMKNLDVVYIFTDTVNGRGKVHEVCPANTFLANALAGTEAVRFVICA